MEGDKMHTIAEVMEILKISRITLYRYIKSKKLSAYKLGREYRIKQEDLQKFLEHAKVK